MIRISSAVGAVQLGVRVHEGIAPGTVSVPHGYRGLAAANRLISSSEVDPLTGMVLQSGLPVTVESVTG